MEKIKKRVMLIYPPGKLYQRGEDRSQGNVENSTATAARAANDLGYGASTLKQKGFEVFLKDYQSEKLELNDLISDVNEFKPNVIFISITNATIFSDLEIVAELKKNKQDLVVILKGALFFNPENEMINQLDLQNVDYLIGGESDFVLAELVYSHFFDEENIPNIKGILYKAESDWVKTDFSIWETNLDKLPFPDRSLMNNSLYLRPDTQEPQVTISTSRGCPFDCVFCLTPNISGTTVRHRSPKNILEELKECYFEYGIRNFFFKSDTFTINKDWVKELCELICASELDGKIEWVANSRVNTIDEEMLIAMKKAGCWLVAFGIETGSEETLDKIKKSTTIEQARLAVKYAKNAGLKTFGFYVIGFPWEDKTHISSTKNLMFELDTDFVELHIALPYIGTKLYDIAKNEKLINESVLGRDYFNSPTIGTKYLSINELEKARKKFLLQYHLRPKYIINKLIDVIKTPKVLKNYIIFGMRLIKNSIFN